MAKKIHSPQMTTIIAMDEIFINDLSHGCANLRINKSKIFRYYVDFINYLEKTLLIYLKQSQLCVKMSVNHYSLTELSMVNFYKLRTRQLGYNLLFLKCD